eukprot:16451725-Heterocapsa_arctica.AAC.2
MSAWTATASASAKLSCTFLSSSSSWKGARAAAGRRSGILASSSHPPAWTRPPSCGTESGASRRQ